jgi:putative Holliday junction resolvase
MRLMGIDYGEKRIGLAITDECSIIAQPLTTIIRNGGELKEIFELVEQYKIGKVIVGLPLNLNGSVSASTGRVQGFTEKLKEAVKIPVEYWDERLTSKEVEKMLVGFDVTRKKRQKRSDSLCACVILRTYLEAHSI